MSTLTDVLDALEKVEEAFVNRQQPITVVRMHYLLDRVRVAGTRLIDARIDEARRP